MLSKQKQEMKVVTQVGFGGGISGQGNSLSKAPKPKCKGEGDILGTQQLVLNG